MSQLAVAGEEAEVVPEVGKRDIVRPRECRERRLACYVVWGAVRRHNGPHDSHFEMPAATSRCPVDHFELPAKPPSFFFLGANRFK